MLYGLRIPIPEPIGEPSGITAAQPGVLEAAGEDRVVVRVREDREALVDEGLGGLEQLDRVREERPVVADHLELDPVASRTPRARAARCAPRRAPCSSRRCSAERTAPAASISVEHRAVRGRVHAAQRDGDDLGPRGDAAPAPSTPASESRRCPRSAASSRCARRARTPRPRRPRPRVRPAAQPPWTALTTSTAWPSRAASSPSRPAARPRPRLRRRRPRRVAVGAHGLHGVGHGGAVGQLAPSRRSARRSR